MAFEYQGFATLGVNLNRQKYGPLDISNVFNSQGDLDYYLSKGTNIENVSEYWYKSETEKVVPYPYAGQIIALVENGKVNVYVLEEKEDGTFKTAEIGGTVLVDDSSISSSDDGQIKIKNFNEQYYKYVAAEGDVAAHYTLVDGFKEGLEPKVRMVSAGNYEIAWYEPNPTTVEGLSSQIASLNQSVGTLSGQVGGIQTTVNDHDRRIDEIVDDVNTNTSDISGLKGLTSAHQSKLATIDENADVNVIESVEVAGVALDVDADKKASISKEDLASALSLGSAAYSSADSFATPDSVSTAQGIAEDALEQANTNKGAISNINSTISGLATKEEVSDLETSLNTNIGKKVDQTAYDTKISSIEGSVQGVTNAVGNVTASVNVLVGQDTNKSARTIASEEVAKIVANAPEAYDTLKEIADYIATDASGAAELSNKVTQNSEDISKLREDLTNESTTRTNAISGINASIEGLTSRVEGNEGSIETLNTEINGLKTRDGELADLIQGNTNEIAKKVSIEEGKSLVDNELISKLEGVAEGAEVNYVKSVKTGELVVSGAGELSIVQIEQDKVVGLVDALSNAGKVNSVIVGETEILPVDKKVTIPYASSEVAGVVKPVGNEFIMANGNLSINKINVNKLEQTTGEELILDGGNA